MQERIALFEGLCSDYIELFARQPDLYRQAPSVFSALSQTEWRAEVRSVKEINYDERKHVLEAPRLRRIQV